MKPPASNLLEALLLLLEKMPPAAASLSELRGQPLSLGLDLGTSSLKVVLRARSGRWWLLHHLGPSSSVVCRARRRRSRLRLGHGDGP